MRRPKSAAASATGPTYCVWCNHFDVVVFQLFSCTPFQVSRYVYIYIYNALNSRQTSVRTSMYTWTTGSHRLQKTSVHQQSPGSIAPSILAPSIPDWPIQKVFNQHGAGGAEKTINRSPPNPTRSAIITHTHTHTHRKVDVFVCKSMDKNTQTGAKGVDGGSKRRQRNTTLAFQSFRVVPTHPHTHSQEREK